MYETTYTLYRGDTGLQLEITYRVTSWGSSPHYRSLTYAGDSGNPPEWEVEEMVNSETREDVTLTPDEEIKLCDFLSEEISHLEPDYGDD